MARENKRTRNERRFGKAERLADRILESSFPGRWAFPFSGQADLGHHLDLLLPLVKKIQSDLPGSPVFVAKNVCQVYWDSPKDAWDYREDFPNSAPPFAKFFVESSNPGTMVIEGGRRVETTRWCPDQWGVMFWGERCDGSDFEIYCGANPDNLKIVTGGDYRRVHVDDARWRLRCALIGFRDGLPAIVPAYMEFAIGGRGEILLQPLLMAGRTADPKDAIEAASLFHSLLKPILLSISFLHCKNVAWIENQPDRGFDRERRKAGLKPFVRYHTINIEPMKKVLRTEGQIESEGLKRALHRVRGHFATYTPERPLFGKFPGTFWMPEHVRGSIKEGVVFSDYKVNAGNSSQEVSP